MDACHLQLSFEHKINTFFLNDDNCVFTSFTQIMEIIQNNILWLVSSQFRT